MRVTSSSVQPKQGARKARSFAVAILATTALVATGCAKDSGGAGGDSAIQLGVIVAETGPIAGSGKDFANGGRIAAEQINDGDLIGGGKSLELVEKEGSEDPAKSASVATQLAANQSVVGLVGAILSPVAGAVKPIAKSNEMPFMIWGATEEGLAEPPYVFRTVTMPQPANKKAAITVAKETGIETVAFGIMTDNEGIVSQAEAFQEGMDKAGVESLGVVETLSTQTNFAGSATDLIQKNADAIVVSGTHSNDLGLIAALHNKGYDGQIITGQTITGEGAFESQPKAVAGVPFPVYFLASTATGHAKDFNEAYRAEYGQNASDFAAQGYNAVYTMAMAMKSADGDVTRASLSKSLTNMTELNDTIYGTVTFEDGQLQAKSAVQIANYTAPDGVVAPWEPGN